MAGPTQQRKLIDPAQAANSVFSMRDALGQGRLQEVLRFWWLLKGDLLADPEHWDLLAECQRWALMAVQELRQGPHSSFPRDTARRLESLLVGDMLRLHMGPGHFQAAADWGRQAATLARERGDWALLARALCYAAFNAYYHNYDLEALTLVESAQEALVRCPPDYLQSVAPIRVVLSEVLQRDLPDTFALSGYGTEEQMLAVVRMDAHDLKALLQVERQEFGAADQELHQADTQIESHLTSYPNYLVTQPLHRGLLLQSQGKIEEAEDRYREFLGRARAAQQRAMEGVARLRVAEVTEIQGKEEETWQLAQDAFDILMEMEGKQPEADLAWEIRARLELGQKG